MAQLQKAPWSEWQTVRLIGRGSFGTVYEIQRTLVDDEIESGALKVISIPQHPDDVEEMYSEGYDRNSITTTFNEHLKSIVTEYSLMRKMEGSTNIVNCKDIRYIQHDDGIGWDIFIRMELLTPLMKALPVDIPESTAIKVAKDLCSALVLCKKHGIIHRDIKPQNIFVSPHGDYKLGDFGIAKTVEKTMGGTKIGTYKYMAPEVYHNQPYGSAADIYSLGLVLYWLLNERRMPFMPLPPAKLLAGQEEESRNRRLSGEPLPAPAHGSAALKQIVLKACAFDPRARYASAAAMLEDLNRLTDGAGVVISGRTAVNSRHNEPESPSVPVSGSSPYDMPLNAQGSDTTVGPIWRVGGQSHDRQPDTSENDATAGPFFKFSKSLPTEQADKTEANEPLVPDVALERADHDTAADLPGQPEEKRKSGIIKYIFIALGAMVAIVVLLLLLRSCDGAGSAPSADSQPSSATESTESNLQHSAVAPVTLAISEMPGNVSYYVGDTLDPSGMVLSATYDDGITETITDGFTCSPTVLNTAGTQTITVSYGGKTVTFTVSVSTASVSSISVESAPDKTSYYLGDTLNTSGLVLTVTYENGVTETITDGFTCDPTVLSTAGTQTVTVSYGGKTATFSVKVSAVSVSSIAVKTPPDKTSYYLGDTLNASGLTLTVTYENGATETVAEGFTCSPTTLSTAGTQTITVSYGGKTATFSVNVSTVSVSSVSVNSKPSKTSYYVGDTLDPAGLTLSVAYNNGKTETVSSGFTCSPTTLNTAGTQTVTVSYGGKTATFSVEVLAVTVSSISIRTTPSKTSYFVGETLDTSGLTLTVIYNNGTAKTVSSGFACSPTTLSTAGTQTITVSYGGKKATFSVNVSAVSVSSISIRTLPSKTSYYVGETLSASGLTLTVVYNDGTSKTVSSGFSCSPTALSTAGTQTITVSYGGKTATFSVNVSAVSVSSISIYSTPSTTSYYLGESLDTYGLAVRVEYSNGSSEIVRSGFSCYPTTFNTLGTESIIVSYDGALTSFTVSVEEPTISLSVYNESLTMNCWPSYWDLSRDVPLWKIYLPSVTTSPSGGYVFWNIVSGSAYIYGDYIAAQQPGTIVARATFEYCGYTYTADYTVNFGLYKVPTATNYLMKSPSKGSGSVTTVPAGATVYITSISWDASVRASDGKYFLWGWTTYNGKSGWIVIS